MKRVRLGVYIPDREYADRFTSCLVNHYQQQLELHMYTDREALQAATGDLDVILMEACGLESAQFSCPIVCLADEESPARPGTEEGCVQMVEKYQEVSRIVDAIMRQIGDEVRGVQHGGGIGSARLFAVYSLSENEYQMPLAVTLASILSERERVLILDLQENSGFSQLVGERQGQGLEDLLVMAASGRFASGRMVSCIGHMEQADYVYPVKNTECLCETEGAVYRSLVRVLAQEMGYQTVIVNLGSRFVGFFELLNECQEIYLVKPRGGLAQWRQQEFLGELETHGMEAPGGRLHEVELPVLTNPAISCERLVEQWKWNEFGDRIRGMVPGVMACG